MGLMAGLKTDEKIEVAKDQLGGGGVLESGLYDLKIDAAFVEKATSGALALVLHGKMLTGESYRTKLWIMGGDKKGNKPYYEKNGEKFFLPGYLHANSITQLTINTEISDVETELKYVNIYDFDLSKEVPKEMEHITEMHGKVVTLGIIKRIVDKNKQNPTTKEYEPTGETREENEIDKVFFLEDGRTLAEIEDGVEAGEGVFKEKWGDKHTGVTQNRAKSATGGAKSGAPAKSGVAATKLFKR